MTLPLIIMFWFIIKHFVVDFLLQRPYQYLNKGRYGHPGGLFHAGLHGLATIPICYFYFPVIVGPTALLTACNYALFDAIIHYHIDWDKVNINKRYKWKADSSDYFWWLLGLDQTLHLLTYLGIIYLIIH